MKKYPKIVQADKRGQIVIPKDIRNELGIEEGSAFWMYSVTDEGILLKKVDAPPLEDHQEILDEIEQKSDKIGVKQSNVEETKQKYKKTKKGNLDVI